MSCVCIAFNHLIGKWDKFLGAWEYGFCARRWDRRVFCVVRRVPKQDSAILFRIVSTISLRIVYWERLLLIYMSSNFKNEDYHMLTFFSY